MRVAFWLSAACGPGPVETAGTLSRCLGCWPTDPRFSLTKTVAGKHAVRSHGSLAAILCGNSCDQTYIRRARPAAVWEHHALSPAVLGLPQALAGQDPRFCGKGARALPQVMRAIWILSAVLLLALLGFFYSRDRMMGCDALESGATTLHLVRSNVDTIRARFCHAADCRLIAEQMNKAERALWHCE